MKVLYIGYYKENSDWGKITTNNILALDAAGVDVVCRPVKLSQPRQISGRLKELEEKSVEGCDVCIQHVFPEHMVGAGVFKKNIGVIGGFFVELSHTSHPERISQLDEIWAPTTEIAEHLDALGINSKLMPFASDPDVYTKNYRDIHVPTIEENFKFYAIVDPNDLKLIETIFTCFYAEFDCCDKASIVLLLTSAAEGINEKIQQISRTVKQALNLQSNENMFPKEVVISEANLSQTNLYEIHKYGDCYLDVNSGLSWSCSLLDAVGFGCNPISTDWGSGRTILGDEVGELVRASFKCRKSQSQNKNELENGKDFFLSPCEKEVREKMRKLYEEWYSNPIKYKKDSGLKGLARAREFSLENIGNKMKEALNV